MCIRDSFIGAPKNLLINQLLMTPVFGLETDESWEIEESKAIYNELKNKKTKSEEENEKLRNVEKKLKKNLPKRATPETSEKSLDLLKRIEANLNIQ